MSAAAVSPNESDHQALLVLALCPALAVSDTVINALGLGVAAIVAGAATTTAASLLQRLPGDVRWPMCVFVLAATVSCIGLFMNAWFHELHRSLGLFLPLIAVNVAIHLRAEESAKLALPGAVLAGLRIGAIMALVLLVLGVAREIVGRGSLFHDARVMLGDWAGALELQLFRADMGFLLAMLPPGAFISLGLLLAVRNWIGSENARTKGRRDERT